MNKLLVIDIETAPTSNPTVIENIRESISVPGNYKKPDSIAEWYRTQGVEVMNERVAQTALKGMQGELIALGFHRIDYAPNGNGGIEILFSTKGIHVRERHRPTVDFLHEVMHNMEAEGAPTLVAGHNIVQFDLPFLWQQCVRYGVPWIPSLPILPSAFDDRVLDTMTGLVGHRNTISLKDAALACGIAFDPEAGASAEIPDVWESGNHALVERHLDNDVNAASLLAQRIITTRFNR